MVEGSDAVVVGCDLAAGAAAVALVAAGLRVVCVDPVPSRRGPDTLLWPSELGALPPDLVRDLPAPPRAVEHRWQILSALGDVSVEARNDGAEGNPSGPYVVDDRGTGRWLIGQAVARGATRVEGPTTMVREGETVSGVRVADRELRAPVTLVSEPGVAEVGGPNAAPGVSATFRVEPASLRGRLGLRPGGAASTEAVLGFLAAPARAIGYVIAGNGTLTLGVFDAPSPGFAPAPATILDQYRAHPSVALLLAGAEPVGEPEARYLPAGPQRAPETPGLLRIGRAAGCDGGAGPIVTGPAWAIRSGTVAASVLAQGGEGLAAGFARRLGSSGVLAAWRRQRERSTRVAFRPRLHREYPTTAAALFHRLMTESGDRKESVVAAVRATRRARRVSAWRLAADAVGTGASL